MVNWTRYRSGAVGSTRDRVGFADTVGGGRGDGAERTGDGPGVATSPNTSPTVAGGRTSCEVVRLGSFRIVLWTSGRGAISAINSLICEPVLPFARCSTSRWFSSVRYRAT